MNLAEHIAFGQQVAYRPQPVTARNPGREQLGNEVVTVTQRREPRRAPQPALVAAINANASHSVSMSARPVAVLYTDAFSLKGMRTTATEALVRARAFLTQGQLYQARRLLEDAVRDFPGDESLQALARIVTRNKATPLPTKFPRRDQEFRWLKANREQYKGKWVALFGANLIATGDSMKQVLDAVKGQQIEGAPLLHKVE